MNHIKSQLGKSAGLPENWVCLGVGYCAKALIHHLPPEIKVTGTSRNPAKWPADLKARVTGHKFDGHLSAALKKALKQADVVIMSQPPSAAGDPFLTGLDDEIMALMPRVKWVGYLSATSVYGDRGGAWAQEHDFLRPGLSRGRYRADAEMAWLETGLPVHVFRLAGIYGGTYFGQNRHPFTRLKAGRSRAVIKPNHVVNRIHAEDVVQAILSSIAAPNPISTYNVADGHPAPPQDVLRFAARLCGLPLPAEISAHSPELSDMARSFYAETKRISIETIKKDLAWRPQFPSYQQGLISIYKSELDTPHAAVLAGHIDVPPARRKIVDEALPRHIKLTRAERGCLRFDVTKDEHIVGRYHIVEIFKSRAALKAHQKRSAASDWAVALQDFDLAYHIFIDDA